MGPRIFVLFPILLFTTPVLAQIYNDKYENVVAPMEQIVDNFKAYTANVQIAGALEDDKSRARRYEENVGIMDKVTDKHFIVAIDESLLDKIEPKQ